MKRSRKHGKLLLFLAITCLMWGCRGQNDMELENRRGLQGESGGESMQDMPGDDNAAEHTEVWGTDILGQDNLGTEAFGQDHLEQDGSEMETFGQDRLGTEAFGAEDLEGNHSWEDNFLIDNAFYYTRLTKEVKDRITGKSFPVTEEPLQVAYEDLAYVHVLHYDFQMQVQEGELICNQAIAQDLVDIFYELYESRYLIEKICLIDAYDADDEASMADNNTSCFNYRTVPGRTKLSNHAYGYAIDINPLYNPYVRTRDGVTLISPDNAAAYADRDADFPHKIDRDDLCYRIFVEHGFTWGGAWNSSKDYQHFEKVP